MAKLVSIGYVANLFGVTAQSVRNWVEKGVLKTKKTVGNHRRFDVEEVDKLRGIAPEERETILYSRVSSHDQKEDLKRQTDELKKYCKEQNIEKYEVIEDLGSGINYQKKGLQKLMKKVIFGEVKRIIIGLQRPSCKIWKRFDKANMLLEKCGSNCTK